MGGGRRNQVRGRHLRPSHSCRCHSVTWPCCLEFSPLLQPSPPQGLCTAATFHLLLPPGDRELSYLHLNPSSTSCEAACLSFSLVKIQTVLGPSRTVASVKLPGPGWCRNRPPLPPPGAHLGQDDRPLAPSRVEHRRHTPTSTAPTPLAPTPMPRRLVPGPALPPGGHS